MTKITEGMWAGCESDSPPIKRTGIDTLDGRTIMAVRNGEGSKYETLEFIDQTGTIMFTVHRDQLFDHDGFRFG